MLPLILAAVLGTLSTSASDCVTHECAFPGECWEIVVSYDEAVSAPNEPHQTITRLAISRGWGDLEGARCFVDYVSREGLWLEGDLVKVPAGALGPLQIRPSLPAADKR